MINFIVSIIFISIVFFILVKFLFQIRSYKIRSKKIDEWWRYSFMYIEESKRLNASKQQEFLNWHISTFLLHSSDKVVEAHKNLPNIVFYFDTYFRPYLK